MTPERWESVKRLYHAALAHPAEDRAVFLERECADDVELRREVESLLAQPVSADDFLGSSALAAEARLIDLPPGVMAPGRCIGAYRIHTLLGAGGMGEVYRARDMRLGRDVALKILPAAFTSEAERLDRFDREARMLAALNHPHIAAIYGLEEAKGVRALVLELVEGETLAQKLAHLPRPQSSVPGLPIVESLAIARQVADALGAAHRKGIIHRDLKPANIKVSPDGVVKVLDFGLARAVSGDGIAAELTHAPTMTVGRTREGMILGTAAYMSPEQARGKPVDRRADIWAFGCVLYEMLAGRTAFAGETIADTLAAIIEREPEWNALPAATPAAIVDLLRLSLEKEPGRRLRDMADARTALDEAGSDRAPTSSPRVQSKGLWRSTRLRSAVASVTLLVVGLAVGRRWAVSPHARSLNEKDTIVLADVTNTTDEPIFDGTLRQGLSVRLEQSPFLSIVPDQQVQRTLQTMGREPDVRLTGQVAQELCQRTGSAAVLEGSISRIGSRYDLILKAVNCGSGATLASTETQAADKNQVLDALGAAAAEIRTRLGEALTTVQKFDTPLPQATTPSLEAFKAFSSGYKVLYGPGGSPAAIPFFKHAIEVDPRFAFAHAILGRLYMDVQEFAKAADATRRAYELRSRASEPEKFMISASYHAVVTGNLETAEEPCQLWIQEYPRAVEPRNFLAGLIWRDDSPKIRSRS